jgi:Ca-activated chloride channel homolog
MSGQIKSPSGLTGQTKILLGLVGGFAVVAVAVRLMTGNGGDQQPPPPPTPTPAVTVNREATVPPESPSAPGDPVKISILTTDTKAEWLGAVTDDFNAAGIKTAAGRPIQVEMLQVSGPDMMMQGVLAGNTLKPVLWSPGDTSWIDQANELLKNLGQGQIVKDECPPVVYVPTGFIMWRPMAEALGWPNKPIGWKQIVELADDPQGWAKYGHPAWGPFTFGHTHPEQSTTGFNILASLAYAAAGKTEGLTRADVKSDAVVDAFRKLEKDTYHYGLSSRGLLDLMATAGPAYLHAASSSETAFIKNEQVHQKDLIWPRAFIFPAEGVFWSDNPTCILEASWVSPEQREAAVIYRDFLLAPPQQDMAVRIGLRPAAPGIALHCPICLQNGTDPGVTPKTVPPLEGVSGETNAAIIDVFKETKKKATVAVLLDTSGSMQGEKIKEAVAGTLEFLQRLHKDDEIYAFMFNDAVTQLQPAGRVGDVGEKVSEVVKGLFADGNTTLNDAVCTAMVTVDRLKEEDKAAGESRLYGIVLLSDGKDTNSKRTENDMVACLPSGEDVEGVKIYTIAYGDDADKDLLTRIANRTNGKTFVATPENIKQIYLAISAEQ